LGLTPQQILLIKPVETMIQSAGLLRVCIKARLIDLRASWLINGLLINFSTPGGTL
jgi:hypothetical protein